MNRTLKLLLGVVVAAGLVVPALAQNFPDVPEYHWAYDALKTLRDDGLLVGYPDGQYLGWRPMSRYEFAVAMNAAYQRLKYQMEGLDSRIDGIQRKIDDLIDQMGEPPDLSDYATKAELQDLKTQLDALKGDLNAMKGWKDDIDALKRLSSTFEQDLASLGVDVEAFKKDLRSMEDRITALENAKPRVNIGGDVNVYGYAGHSRDDKPGIGWNGQPYGVDSNGNPTGVADDLHMMHELGLTLSGEYGNGVMLDAELVVGNLTGFEGGTLTQQFDREVVDPVRKDESLTDVYIHHLSGTWDTAWFGSPVHIALGRIGHQVNPYFLKRNDVDYYVDIQRWDDGNWYFDGGSLEFDWNVVDWTLFGGKIGGRGSTQFSDFFGMRAGELRVLRAGADGRPGNDNWGLLSVDTLLGTTLAFEFGDRVELNVSGMLLDGPDTPWVGSSVVSGFDFNRLFVWGAELDVDIGKNLGLEGYLTQTDYYFNDDSQHDDDNWAADGRLTFKADKFDAAVGYRLIGPYFAAPGDWGRIGYWQNPADIEGFYAGVQYNPNGDLSLYATGEMYHGSDRAEDSAGTVYGLSKDDDINRIQVGVGFQFSENWHLGLGWEGVFWSFDPRPNFEFGGGDIDEHYYTADLSYDLGEGAMWRFGYQISDYENKLDDSFFNTPRNPFAEAKGGLFFTQFSLKF